MAVSKHRVLRFIEDMEDNAVSKCKQSYNQKERELKAQLTKKYDPKINLIQNLINSSISKLNEVIQDMADDEELRANPGNYYTPVRTLNELSGNMIKSRIEDICGYPGQVSKLMIEKESTLSDIKEQYSNVYNNCKSMRSTAKCIEYLKSLGFDTSSLEQENLSLVAEIDTSKLYL